MCSSDLGATVVVGQGLTNNGGTISTLGDAIQTIPTGTSYTNNSGYQHLVFGDLAVDGTYTNDGTTVLINGTVSGGGSYVENGTLQILNFAEESYVDAQIATVIDGVDAGAGLTGSASSGTASLSVNTINGVEIIGDSVGLGGTLTTPTTIKIGRAHV